MEDYKYTKIEELLEQILGVLKNIESDVHSMSEIQKERDRTEHWKTFGM